METRSDFPDDLETLRAALAAATSKANIAAAELALARAKNADDAALIARQKLEIAKLKRELCKRRAVATLRLARRQLIFGHVPSSIRQ